MKFLMLSLISLFLIGCSQDSSDSKDKIVYSDEDESLQFDVDGMGITDSSGSVTPFSVSTHPTPAVVDLRVMAKNIGAGSILAGVSELATNNANLNITSGCSKILIGNEVTSVEEICQFQISEISAREGSNQYHLALLYKDGADNNYYRRFYSITFDGDQTVSDASNLDRSSLDVQFGSIETNTVSRSLVLKNSSKSQNAPVTIANLASLSRFKISYNSCPAELAPRKKCIMRFSINSDSSIDGIITESFLINGQVQSLTATFPEIVVIPPEQALELELSANLIDLGGALSSQELRTIVVKNTTSYDLPSITTSLNPDINVIYNSCEGKSLAINKKCIIRFLLDPSKYSDSLSFLEVESLPYASSVASIYAGDGSDVNVGGSFTLDEILGARLDGDKVYMSGDNEMLIKGTCDANKNLSLLSPLGVEEVVCDGSGLYSHLIDAESINSSQGEGFWSFTLSYIQGNSLTKTVETDHDDDDPAKMPDAVFDVTRFDQSVFGSIPEVD